VYYYVDGTKINTAATNNQWLQTMTTFRATAARQTVEVRLVCPSNGRADTYLDDLSVVVAPTISTAGSGSTVANGSYGSSD
jgi:hypothetical protein